MILLVKKFPQLLDKNIDKSCGSCSSLVSKFCYSDEPKPEYAPKKKSVNKPKAAIPPTVATIQRGILPISLIAIILIN
jgi:hypothetical protein